MDNLFESTNYPTSEPDTLTAGSLWAWTRPDITDAYPTSLYTLRYDLTGLDSPYPLIQLTADKVSSAHVIEATSTESYTAMDYRWRAVVIRDADSAEVTVDEGLITVAPAYANTEDAASYTYRVLQKIRATIEGTATREEASYSIGGRSLAVRSPEELLALEAEFRKRWQREKDEINRKAGRSTGRRVLVGMRA
jgi:hypothetical protein